MRLALCAVPTPSERRALLFVAAVAALGLGVRGLRAVRPQPADANEREALASQIAAVDSAVSRGGRVRRKSGPQPTERAARVSAAPAPPLDLDRASEAELDALPGIGPALARRIVENRSTHGPFGSLDALQEVRGIGPALAAKLAPLVSFSAPPRPMRASDAESRALHP